MRLFGLDIGEKRIGVAVSDPDLRVATPLEVIDAEETFRVGSRLTALVQEYEVGGMVVGLPRSLDGSEGPQAARVRALGRKIEQRSGLSIRYVDERMSSVEARRRMTEMGLSSRQQRGRVDMIAAAVILQAYLDGSVSEEDRA